MKNNKMKVEFKPIGIMHSPHKRLDGMPIQPAGAVGVKGKIEIFELYREGLDDLSGFSHIILIYFFHKSKGFQLHVTPFMDNKERGLFATRAPKRPNPIGLSIVKLVKVEDNILYVENIDLLDKTPILDIKPYVPEFETEDEVRAGWLEEARKTVSKRRSDNRFKG